MNNIIKKIFILTAILSTFSLNFYSATYSKTSSGSAKDLEKAKQIKEELQKRQKQKESQEQNKKEAQKLKVAFIPFEFSSEVTEDAADTAVNEIAIAMILNNSIQPYSVKEWLDEIYKEKPEKNLSTIVKKAADLKLPVDYLCHGIIFKCGNKFGLKVGLYPLNNDKNILYFFRDFVNFNSFNLVASEIVHEMILKTQETQKPLLPKKIYINNIVVKFKDRLIDKNGKLQEKELDSLDIKKVLYKKDDNFISELLLYNLYLSNIFLLKNNNLKKYVNHEPFELSIEQNPTEEDRKKKAELIEENPDVNFILSGNLDITREKNKFSARLIIKVTNNDIQNIKVLFYKEYLIDKINLDNLYKQMRECSQHVILSLLDSEEQKKVGEINIDSYYGNDKIL